MNYVESFYLLDTEAKQIPCTLGAGVPTTSTEGAVGLFYMDTKTGSVYKCIAVTNGNYTWELFNGAIPDWNQTDSTAPDYIKNKPVLGSLATKSTVNKSDLDSSVQTSLGKADTALQSFTETDPTVPSWAKASTKPSYDKGEVGLGNVDNVRQYSASNPPPYPVTSVNGKTGEIVIEVADEIYVGDGDMPEDATIQIIMDGVSEEQALKDELKAYIDAEIANLVSDGKGVRY